MMRFADKTVLITGCGGEMATEMIREILHDGGRVIGIDVKQALLEKSRSLFLNRNFHTFLADIADAPKISEVLRTILDRFRRIDILINHAGSTCSETLATTTPEKWETDVQNNLNGTFRVTQAILENMKRHRNGSIVSISSVNADRAVGNPAYSAAKAGLNAFSKAIAMEYGSYNIRSNVVSPGSVKTEAWKYRIEKNPDTFDNLMKWYPLKRLATPKDVAKAALFLSSDDAGCISGVNLRVDAGLSAGCAMFAQDITSQNFGV